jgi:hypothetical protein
MKLTKKIVITGAMALALSPAWTQAKVSAAEAAKLGTTLTPVGAEKAGNADGTIPAWTGGIQTPPPSFKDEGWYPDPYADEKPLFTITKANLDKYKDKLSAGQIAMFNRYADYKMNIYKTHRSASYPQKVYDGAKANATTVELVDGGNGISTFKTSVPFPIPQNGLEVVWNHITRFRSDSGQRTIGQATPLADGKFSVVVFQEQIAWRTSLTDAASNKDTNVLFYFKQRILSPARLAGNVLLVHETIDQVKEPRRAWVYNAGQRRVRRAPQVAYDGPGTASDGLRTSDNFDMFNGAPDRYTWKLDGKQELYIPYDSYELGNPKYKYSDILKAGHINQDIARYELHRVWKVTATLKPGMRHIYAKRVMYFDEDSWGAAVIDHYDGRGEFWRLGEGHAMNFYDVKVPWYKMEVLSDILSGRYIALGLTNEIKHPYDFKVHYSSSEFTPAALRRSGVR